MVELIFRHIQTVYLRYLINIIHFFHFLHDLNLSNDHTNFLISYLSFIFTMTYELYFSKRIGGHSFSICVNLPLILLTRLKRSSMVHLDMTTLTQAGVAV